MNRSHYPLQLSIVPLIGLCLMLCLSGCGRSDRDRSEHAPVTKDLSWCAENGDLNGVKAFLTAENINGSGGQDPPLHLAAKGGQINVVDFLVSNGAEINKIDNRLGWSPVHYAVSSGHADVVAKLIGYGAKIDISDPRGNYPIHTASSQGHLAVVKLLLQSGARADQPSDAPTGDRQRMSIASEISSFKASNQYQPIHSAAEGNQPEVVKFYIELGISPDTKDGNGKSVLDYAVSKWGWSESRAATIRLVDRDGAFERSSKSIVSTEGYYVTDETNPIYIRFMPEELVKHDYSSEVFPTKRAIICRGARGGKSADEIAKWLSPHNEEAKKQGRVITGRYKIYGGSVSLETFDGSYVSFSREGDQLKVLIRSMQQEFFPESSGSGTVIMCKFVSWK